MRSLGRYTLYGRIASGGMATVHLGRLAGEAGFARTVAIKCLHKHLALDPEFSAMFADEARLAARIRHPNVVATFDVESLDGELFVVMEYVHGAPLSRLIRYVAGAVDRVPFGIASAVMTNVLAGLHAAHEVRDTHGNPLDLVHRDVSPQNVLVGTDGIARVIDFGVAKARGRLHTTQDGRVKGKLAYMPPEQLRGGRLDRRADIYAAGVVLWELLTLVRLFGNESDATTIENALQRRIEPPSAFAADVPPALDEVVMRALARDPADRFDTAKQMATALEAAMPVATQAMVGAWVEETARGALGKRTQMLAEIERATTRMDPVDLPSESAEPSTMATPVRHARARRRRGVGVLLATIVAGAAGATALHRSAREDARGEPAAPPVLSPTPSLAPAAAAARASSAATASETASPSSRPDPSAHRHRKRRSRCDPPYTVGADGIRRYKLDCLK